MTKINKSKESEKMNLNWTSQGDQMKKVGTKVVMGDAMEREKPAAALLDGFRILLKKLLCPLQ